MKSLPAHRLIVSAVLALSALAAASAQAGPFSSLVIFGDSVSDSGNVALATGTFSGPPTSDQFVPDFSYASGTFSNGPVWATSFAGKLGLAATPSLVGGTNFAFGGARTGGANIPSPTLTSQVGQYLFDAGNHASATALYVVAGVGNDARDTLATIAGGTGTATTLSDGATSYANNVAGMVGALEAAGAKHILVLNTVNLGVTPYALSVDQFRPGFAGLATTVSASFDGALAARLQGDADVTLFDTFAFLSGVVQSNGFGNVTKACGAVAGADCSQYLFWDAIHPTAAAQQTLANAVYAQVVPEPATYALFAFGLIGVALARRRG
jgi:outer membrane lipase/esterase